jgi:DNA polymerase-1
MLVASLEEYEAALSYLNARPDDRITCDTETNNKDWRRAKVCGVPVHRGDQSFYFPFRHGEGPNLPLPLLHRLFAEVIRPDRLQTWHHYSYDGKVLAGEGIPLATPEALEDTILAALIMNENEDTFKLEELTAKYIDKDAGTEETALINYICQRFGGSRKDVKGRLWRCPSRVVAPYGEQDVWSTHRLREFYDAPLKRWNVFDVWRETCEYQITVIGMELRGITIDMKALTRLKEEAEFEYAYAMKEIEDLAGYPLNPNSPKQVSAWMKIRKTDKQTLKQLGDDPRASLIIRARQWAKADSTYYAPYREYVGRDGILRCNLHLTTPGTRTPGAHDKRNGTISGRLSSSDPNLQQIPRESDTYKVKEVFVARPGHALIELDYSQAELRIAAFYSQDGKLASILLSGGDMHGIVSQELNITRGIAKNVNFSAWYGIGAETFSRNYYVPLAQSKIYLANYHRMFPGIKRLQNVMIGRARRHGYIRIFNGRLRHYDDGEFAPVFTAPNNIIQGSVGGIMQRAGNRIRREVPEANLTMQIHDAYWLEPTIEDAPHVLNACRRIMQEQEWIAFPMIVDAKQGGCIGRAKSLPRSPEGIPQAALDMITDWKGCGFV